MEDIQKIQDDEKVRQINEKWKMKTIMQNDGTGNRKIEGRFGIR
ncbi:hypothetical protein [Brotaphodocola sp.]